MNRPITIAMVVALAALGCGSKEDGKEARCTSVCSKIQQEELAACTDDGCKSDAKAKFDACKGLCATIAKGPGKSLDEQAAEAEAKCNKGDMDECATIAGAYLLGKAGKPKDEAKGLELAKKACDGGSMNGCELQGRIYNDGRGVAVDKAMAKTLFTKACDGNAGGACRSLALTFESSDPARIPLLEKACAKDDGIGCLGLGAAYKNGGQGAPQDTAKAKQFLQKACDLKIDSACGPASEL